jgi:glutamate dehydrogenase (NAD(P)+)
MGFKSELVALTDRFSGMSPELEVTVRDIELGVEGHVVVWNTSISAGGPLALSGKGGNRITPTVSLDEVRRLARIMAVKNAAAGLPLGGAKSGLRANPFDPGHERIYRRWVSLCRPILHENGGVFGGFGYDLGGRSEHAIWACDELGSRRSFTGKPPHMGGTDYDREGIAGLGVAVAAERLLQSRGQTAQGATFAVQGIGAMGAAVIKYFGGTGASLRCVSDPRLGGCFSFDHPVSPALLRAIAEQDFDEARALVAEEGAPTPDVDAVLASPVDVLFPCAVHDVITETNVRDVRAGIICEGANGPCTPGAVAHLEAKGIVVAPDFLVNAGGIIAAFVELTTPDEAQTGQANKASVAKALTESKISTNVRRAVSLAEANGSSLGEAARYLALSRIFGLEPLDG